MVARLFRRLYPSAAAAPPGGLEAGARRLGREGAGGEQGRKGVQGAAARRFEATGDEDDDGDRTTGRR